MSTTVKMKVPSGTPVASTVFLSDGTALAVSSTGLVDMPFAKQSAALNSGFAMVGDDLNVALTVSTDSTDHSLTYIPTGYGSTLGYLQMTLSDGTLVAVPYFAHT